MMAELIAWDAIRDLPSKQELRQAHALRVEELEQALVGLLEALTRVPYHLELYPAVAAAIHRAESALGELP